MTDKEHDPEAIIQGVLSRYRQTAAPQKTAMARAVLVVDENVKSLAPALREANFRIVVPPEAMSDEDIKASMMSHRILVTKNTKDFLKDAPIFEYGIISLEALKFIDSDMTYKKNSTARMISEAISEFNLVSERGGFVLFLKPEGSHVFKKLG